MFTLYNNKFFSAGTGGGSIVSTPIDVHCLIDMETGTNGQLITPALMSGAFHGSIGTWQSTGITQMSFISSGEILTRGSIRVSGVTYNDASSSRAIKVTNNKDTEYMRFVLKNPTPKLSVGFFLTTSGLLGNTFNSYDLFQIDGGGQYNVINFQDWPGSQMIFQSHTVSGVSPHTTLASGSQSYWITALSDSTTSGAAYHVYHPTSWVRLGTGICYHDATQNISELRFGRVDSHDHLGPGFFIYDDIIIDITGKFPLLPGNSGVFIPGASGTVNIRPIKTCGLITY